MGLNTYSVFFSDIANINSMTALDTQPITLGPCPVEKVTVGGVDYPLREATTDSVDYMLSDPNCSIADNCGAEPW